jgi:hypothetical protein
MSISAAADDAGFEAEVDDGGGDGGGGEHLSPGSCVFEGPRGASSSDIWFRRESERRGIGFWIARGGV